MRSYFSAFAVLAGLMVTGALAQSPTEKLVIDRKGETIVLETLRAKHSPRNLEPEARTGSGCTRIRFCGHT